ncbi:MAG: endonuclease/exonuclease/phosphatase family protein [Flavobacteriales bacterium]
MKTVIILAILLPLMYLAGVLIYASATRYKPLDETDLKKYNTRSPFMVNESSFTILTWNMGYGGLGEESDFFYDGGAQVRPSKEIVEKNLTGIESFLAESDADFICLQEVDTASKRSYNTNELSRISESLEFYEYFYAKNYDVNFVPKPFLNPLGKITSGLATFSKYPGTYLERISYKSETNWPNYLFMLRRAFSKTHIPLSIGKDLVIINTHNSAYDPSGKMKKSELDILIPYVNALYAEGHYVVVAGDWNQSPPDHKLGSKAEKYKESNFPEDLINEGWNWSYDPSLPTNRKLDKVYSKDSYTALIDFFLVSPNIQTEAVKTIDLDFKFSDHQPVKMSFSIK